jgi:hypothetical protein
MTIQEMHVGIDLGFQAVSLNVWDYFQHEELDYLINKHTIKFIRNRVNPKSNAKREGFQETQKRYEDFAELITNATLNTYVESTQDLFVHGILPYDYLSLLNDRLQSYYNCNGMLQNATLPVLAYYKTWAFGDDTIGTLYDDFIITIKVGSTIQNLFNFAATFSTAINGNTYRPTGLYNLGEKFFIVNQVLYEMNVLHPTSDVRVYWEKYDTLYVPNSFIFISSVAGYTIEIAGVGIPNPIAAATPIDTPISKNRINPVVLGATLVTKPNRLIKTDVYHNYLEHSYLKTKWDSPISRLQGRRIYVHYNNTFTPYKIFIDYIKKPRLCNWYLNISCELHDNFHQEIIDNVVQELKALVNSNNYKNIINENLTLE